ncbi:hypothetical protein ACIPK7_21065 [Pseudomonas sp. NPDC086581]|uniref:hypothetical protein n=1 Tax=Pseudomonas sp. NPDC086581 TaxID=3364432 RepID=UPI0037FCD6EB
MLDYHRKLELGGKVTLALFITFLALSLCSRIDISLFDESIYLSQGLGQFPDFSQYERSPLYSLYYYLVNLKVSDPLSLYIIGSTLNITLCISLLLLAAYKLTHSLAYCTLAFILLASSNLIEVWPYISFLAISLISLGAMLTYTRASTLDSCSISAVIFFLLCFIRPEFVISFYTSLALAILLTANQLRIALRGDFLSQLSLLRTSAFSLAALIILSVTWSFPVLSSGGRSFLAFGQHYALRKFETGQTSVDPWLNWLSILHKDAPDTNSISDILRHYPKVLTNHILANINDFLTSISKVFSSPFTQGLTIALMVALALLLLVKSILIPRNPEKPRREARSRRGAIIFLILASAPPLISTFSIYPRTHYTLIIFCCGTLLLAALLANRRISHTPVATGALLIALGLLIPPPIAHDRVNFSSIMEIRSSTTIHKMLEVDGGWCIYLSCQFIFATEIPAGVNATQYIEQNGIDAVMVSPRMKEYAQSISDRSLQNFLDTATQGGWRSMPLRNGSTLLKKI